MIYPIIKNDDAETRQRAAEIISSGGIVAFRTDTFYGLGVDPMNARAVHSVNNLKGREASGKPILIIVSDESEARRFVETSAPLYQILMKQFWPGALTIIGTARPGVPEELTAKKNTVGVRLPEDASVREFVRACGGALTATSANRAGEPPARSASDVLRYFPNELNLIVDGGETRAESPSTVVDVSTPRAALVREGIVPREALEETLRAINVRLF